LQAHPLGGRFAYVLIDVPQPNGVDFCIAFYLGEFLARHPPPTASSCPATRRASIRWCSIL
jgi:hypothetical protein